LKIEIFAKWLWLAGGGELIVATLTKALLLAQHEVVLDTLVPFEHSTFERNFGIEISAATLHINPPIIKKPPKMGGLERYVALANEFAVRRSIGSDVFVDLSPSSCLGATYTRLPDITYWSSPPIDFRSYERQLLKDTPHRIAFTPYVKVLSKLLERVNEIPLNFAISRYSERAIRDRYAGHFRAPMRVLYPPVNIMEWKPPENRTKRRGVASQARFAPWKRHDLQVKIVGNDIPLTMIGAARADDEKETATDLQRRKTENVSILLNQPLEVRKRELWRSKVFLHTADNEPFGIAIVEAIAAGCVPVIRRCGAATEVVPIHELTFTTTSEARTILKRALKGDFDHYLPQLNEHIRKFDESTFTRRFLSAIENAAAGKHGD
jgi:glycosyltransferase involved in cell wall biosynthesis